MKKKKLILFLVFTISTLTLSAQFNKIVYSVITPGESESSAKMKLQSEGFVLRTSDIDKSGTKALLYTSDREDRKNNLAVLLVEQATVSSIRWILKSEDNEKSIEVFDILESDLDKMFEKPEVSFEEGALVQKQSFYPVESKQDLQELGIQIVCDKGLVYSTFLNRKDYIATMTFVKIQKSYQDAFQPYLDELYKDYVYRYEAEDDPYAECSMDEDIVGDLDQNGTVDCIIKWTCSIGYLFSAYGGYAIFLEKDGKPKLSGWHYQAYGREYGSYIDIKTIDAKGIIHAIEYKYTEDDARCCPSIETEKQFIFKNEELIEIR